MRHFRTAFFVMGGVVSVLIILMLGRTLALSPPVVDVDPIHSLEKDRTAIAERLGWALALETISDPDQPADTAAFRALHRLMEEQFPRVHQNLDQSRVNELSLLYRWEGSDPSLPPVLLLGHQDVVPADDASEWTYPPFEGAVADGHVWGRGAMDNKSGVMGLMEAAEWLLEREFQPERTFYLGFGHDEEIGGADGAATIAERFAEEGIHFAFVLDEGGAITHGAMEGIHAPVAVVGIAEKGYLSLELTANVTGGHSSAPPGATAVGVLSRAITRIEDNPLPARIDGAADGLLDRVGPALPLHHRFAVSNRELFGPLLAHAFGGTPETAPLVRTTIAPTMLRAGIRDNVLPPQATAVVNFRLLPGDTREQVIEHVRRTIDDERITVLMLEPSMEASPVSRVDEGAFPLIERAIHQVSPDSNLIVAPYLVFGATDSRHFTALADDVYRFAAFNVRLGDMGRIHGRDERISIEDYAQMIRFYVQIMRTAGVVEWGT